jgi:uncharacterized membrane protein YfcA
VTYRFVTHWVAEIRAASSTLPAVERVFLEIKRLVGRLQKFFNLDSTVMPAEEIRPPSLVGVLNLNFLVQRSRMVLDMAVSVAAKVRNSRTVAKYIWLYGALTFVFLVALSWIARGYSEVTVAGFWLWQIFVIAGILFFSGLMSGLSGFGFSAVGSACLLLIPPKLAVPLLMALSTANQLMSVGQLREDMPKSWTECWPMGPGPVVLGGIAGVPVGIWLLNHLPAERLMILFGILLTAYSAYSIFKPAGLKLKGFDGARSGLAVGAVGGTLGGFTAFPGSAVVVWTGLRGLAKSATRSIVQPYILVLQVVSLATNAYLHSSVFGVRFWSLLGICMPVVLPGTIAGVLLYRRISDVNFKRVSFFLLGLSGLGLLAKVFFR